MDKSSPSPAGGPRPPASDDRPLVAVDPLASQAELSDRLLLWWENNRQLVGGVVSVLLLAVIAWQAVNYVAARRERALQIQFAALVEPADLRKFAADHSTHPLAGVALLRLADQAYEAGRYADAANDYAAAAAALGGSVYADRAKLGQGVSLLQAGKSGEGEPILLALRDDTSAAQVIRAEAAYQAAIQRWTEGRTAAAKELLEWVKTLDGAGMWSYRAQALLDQNPEFR